LQYNLTFPLLFVGGCLLILGTVFALAAIFNNRREKPAPFHNYFGTEYDRSLPRNGSFRDGKFIFSENPATFEDFDVRYPGPTDWPRIRNSALGKRD